MTRIRAAIFTALLIIPGLAAATQPAGDAPVWAVDPEDPGPTLPPVGRALFDHLTMDRRDGKTVQTVPFPFAALVAALRRKAGVDEAADLSAVLVPIGRSLQRDAATPEFFRFPRAVVAFDADSPGHLARSAARVRDRLYLGYQEKAGMIEVISYNEAAARFEFQVVRDYRPAGTPVVRYVERDECTACHQNQAPIFSRPLWQETSGDKRIAGLLAAESDVFYGIPVGSGIDVPGRFDASTDRANLIAAVQRVWRDGCGGDAEPAAIGCRADLLNAALRFRLAGRRHARTEDDPIRRSIMRRLSETWRRNWPGGLAIPNPDIPNRDPLADLDFAAEQIIVPRGLRRVADVPLDEAVRLAGIERELEPFNPRPPFDVWRSPDRDPAVLNQVIAGLAGFFATADIRRLDQLLVARAAADGIAPHAIPVSCRILVSGSARNDATVKFRCREVGQDTTFDGRVAVDGKDASGKLHRFRHDRAGRLISVPLAGAISAEGAEVSLRLVPRTDPRGLNIRLADGTRIAGLRLGWTGEASEPAGSFSGSGTANLVRDSPVLEQAVRNLADETRRGETDVFSALPFRRVAVLRHLFERLGADTDIWCCLDTADMPPATVDGR